MKWLMCGAGVGAGAISRICGGTVIARDGWCVVGSVVIWGRSEFGWGIMRAVLFEMGGGVQGCAG